MKQIIFFYESYQDFSATHAMKNCSGWLKKLGITALAIEKSADIQPLFTQENIENYVQQIESINLVLKDFANPEYSTYIDDVIKTVGVIGPDRLSCFKEVLCSLIVEFKSNILLFDIQKNLGCEPFSMDLPHSSRSPSWNDTELFLNRNQAMIQNIQEHSLETSSKVLVLVGGGHNYIAQYFRDTKEYIVSEIFFDNSSPALRSMEAEIQNVVNLYTPRLRSDAFKNDPHTLHVETFSNDFDISKYTQRILQTVAPNLYFQTVVGEHFQLNQEISQLIADYNLQEENTNELLLRLSGDNIDSE